MKNVYQFLSLLPLLFIPILVSGNSENTNPPEKEVVEVHIYRPSKFAGFGWVFNLKANGENLTKVKNGEHLILNLKPGITKFSIKKKNIVLNLKPGKSYFLRTFLIRDGFIGNIELIEVTDSFAKTELGMK